MRESERGVLGFGMVNLAVGPGRQVSRLSHRQTTGRVVMAAEVKAPGGPAVVAESRKLQGLGKSGAGVG